jgi:hypothetical protein
MRRGNRLPASGNGAGIRKEVFVIINRLNLITLGNEA